MNPFQHMVTVDHNASVIVVNRRPTEADEMLNQRSQGNVECDALDWLPGQSIPPPGCLSRLWHSASTPTKPFRSDSNILCSCGSSDNLWTAMVKSISTHSNVLCLEKSISSMQFLNIFYIFWQSKNMNSVCAAWNVWIPLFIKDYVWRFLNHLNISVPNPS